MKYNFDEVIDRSGTYAVKLEAMPQGAPKDALPVWVADMDFPCAEPIIKALHERVDRRIFGYTMYGSDDVKDVVTGWFRKRFGWEVAREDLVFSPGVVPALAYLIQLLTKEGDGVIIQRPVYHPFANKLLGHRRRIANNALIYENGAYRMDYADLEAKLAEENNKGLILCSPHNPVGRVWTEEELRRVVDLAKRYGKWIISDEIHSDLVRKGVTHHPLLKVAPDYADHIIVCTAPSKTFNLAGMQLSNLVIPNKEWQKQWTEGMNGSCFLSSPSPFGIAALIAAYTEGEEWLEQVRDYIDGNIQYVKDYVKEHFPKAHVVDTEGTYLVWIDFNGYEKDPKRLEACMQKEGKIAFDEGYIFGEEGSGFERLNVATPRKNVEECMRRIGNALEWLERI